jgi:hypothetical protein
MSYNDCYWGDRGHCPKCGKFCGKITGHGNCELGLIKVTGICKTHGEVDLTHQEWSFDDFFNEDYENEI